MIKAIVYLTNTGSTQRYSELLSDAVGLPAFSFKEAAGRLKLNERVFYMGWVMNGRIRGYDRAALRFSIAGACGVGMNKRTDDTERQIKEKTGIRNPRIKVFYARGSFDMDKLSVVHRLLIGIALRALKEGDGEEDVIGLIENGGSFIEPKEIKAAADWITAYNRRFGEVSK